MMDKKGSVIDIIIFVVFAFIIVIFFASWTLGFNLISDTLVGIESNDPLVNISGAASESFGQVNAAQNRMIPILAYALIFGMILTILVSNFLVKAHPVFFIVYLLVIIGAFIVSVYLSNQYEILMQGQLLGTILTSWKGASFMMLNLPIWTAVIGIFGAIFLFSGILRDRDIGGGIS